VLRQELHFSDLHQIPHDFSISPFALFESGSNEIQLEQHVYRKIITGLSLPLIIGLINQLKI